MSVSAISSNPPPSTPAPARSAQASPAPGAAPAPGQSNRPAELPAANARTEPQGAQRNNEAVPYRAATPPNPLDTYLSVAREGRAAPREERPELSRAASDEPRRETSRAESREAQTPRGGPPAADTPVDLQA